MSATLWPQTCIDPVPETDRLEHVQYCSPFVAGLVERNPHWLEQLRGDRLDQASPPHPMRAREWILARGLDDGLRDFRNQEMLRIIWRDLGGLASLGETFSDLSALAQTCLELALGAHHQQLVERLGQPRDEHGNPQKPVVLGVGKLGGHELNVSSDIDLIFCFPAAGHCDGPRARSNDEFFSRLSQKVIATLAQVRPSGFCFRVDTRLRPFGRVGAIACSFASMEQYYQREGRDWERYALVKARPVAGDFEAGQRLLQDLRPFVYRRYIDFGAIESLLDMQSMMRAEAVRKDHRDDIKRGTGGIREIEFLAQGFQLLRGGRESVLQTPRLAMALDAIASMNLLPAGVVDRLKNHYVKLRHIENRIQGMRDQQTHRIPTGEDLLRLIRGLGYETGAQLVTALTTIRSEVSAIFDETWANASPRQSPDSEPEGHRWQQKWLEWRTGGVTNAQVEGNSLTKAIEQFLAGLARRPLGHTAAHRLDRFMPRLLARIEVQALSENTVTRLFDLVLAVSRRSAYLTLLTENPMAFDRTIELFSQSCWVARQVVRFPELLDDLIDPSLGHHIPDEFMLETAVARKLDLADEESILIGLNYLKQATGLRLAVAWLEGTIDEETLQHSLGHLAEALIRAAMQMAEKELERRHGSIRDSALAVIGYGSLGSGELGFNSDLDLVFLYQPGTGESDGERPLAAERWFARLTQRMVALLTALTPSGKLYEIDTRLRPNGQSGLLVSSIEAFRSYQQKEAWTWETQALTRARAVAGDKQLIEEFQKIRRESLGRNRDPETLCSDLLEMRERIRQTHGDGSTPGTELKHGPGGMVDIGFIAQLGVLMTASRFESVTSYNSVSGQLAALRAAGWLDEDQLQLLRHHLAVLRKARFERELESEKPGMVTGEDGRKGKAVCELFSQLTGSVE